MSTAEMRLLPPLALRPTEETRRDRIAEVVALILERQAWTQPICVERRTLAVLDGHHRLAAAIQLGLARVPVQLYDYASVQLGSWRPEITPTLDEVLRRALSGCLYPPKTTRHIFASAEPSLVDIRHLVPGRSAASAIDAVPARSGALAAWRRR